MPRVLGPENIPRVGSPRRAPIPSIQPDPTAGLELEASARIGAAQARGQQAISQALGDISESVADILARKKKQDDDAYESDAVGRFSFETITDLNESKPSAEEGAPGFAQSFADRMAERAKKIYEEAPSSEAGAAIRQRLISLQTHFFARASLIENDAQATLNLRHFNKNLGELNRQLVSDPDSLPIVLEAQQALIAKQESLQEPKVISNLRQQAPSDSIATAIQSLIEKNRFKDAKLLLAMPQLDGNLVGELAKKVNDEEQAAISNSLTLEAKLDARDERLLAATQRDNMRDVTVGIVTGAINQRSQILPLLQSNGLSVTQFNAAVTAIQGEIDPTQDDPVLALKLRDRAYDGDLTFQDILDNKSSLTQGTAEELVNIIDEVERRGGILATDTVRRARDFLVGNVSRVRGAMAILDSESSRREVAAKREFDQRVLDGEPPWAVAEEMSFRSQEDFVLAKPPLYGITGPQGNIDVSASKAATLQALENGDITEDIARRESKLLRQIEEIQNANSRTRPR